MATVYKEVEIDIGYGDIDICEIEEVFDIDEVKNYIKEESDVAEVFGEEEILKAVKDMLANSDITKADLMTKLGLDGSTLSQQDILNKAYTILEEWAVFYQHDGLPKDCKNPELDAMCRNFWECVTLPEDLLIKIQTLNSLVNTFKMLSKAAEDKK